MRGLIRPSVWLVGAALSACLSLSAALAQQDTPEPDEPPAEPPAEIEPVPIRGGEHGDYSRIVFDWESAVPYRVSAGSGRLVVSFDETRDADYRLVNPAILENIRSLEQVSETGQPLRIEMTIAEGSRIRDFNLGPKLVIDIVDDPATASAAADDGDAAQPPTDDTQSASDAGGPTASDGEGGDDGPGIQADGGTAGDSTAAADVESQPADPQTADAGEPEAGPAADETDTQDPAVPPVVASVPDDTDPEQSAASDAEPAPETADQTQETESLAVNAADQVEVDPSVDESDTEQPESGSTDGGSSDSAASDEGTAPVDEELGTPDDQAPDSQTADNEADLPDPAPPETDVADLEPVVEQPEPATLAEREVGEVAREVDEASATPDQDATDQIDEPELALAQSAQQETSETEAESTAEAATALLPGADGEPPPNGEGETPPDELEVASIPDGEPDETASEALAVIEKEIEQAESQIETEQQEAAPEIVVADTPPEPSPPAVPAGRLDEDVVQSQAVFDPGVPSLLSVFRRGDALWVVVATAETALDPTQLAAQGSIAFGPAEIAAADGGVALRYVVDANLHPTVELDGNRWIVRLIGEPQENSRLVEVVPQPEFPLGPRVLVEAEGVQGLVRVADPEIGDVLVVVPMEVPAMGLSRERRFVEVRLLPSTQGLVAELLADTVRMRIVRQGIEITTSTTDGLILSPLGDRRASVINTFGAPIPDSLLRVGDWQGPPAQFNNRRQALQRNVAVADDENLPRARLDLARFYFAHGYGSEASGLLSLMQTADEGLVDRPDYRALQGAADLIVGRASDALEAFDHDELRGREEIALWRAAANADITEWAAAHEDFQLARALLPAYPAPYSDFFYFRAGRAALAQGDYESLEAIVEQMASATDDASNAWSMTDYFRGMIALEKGDLAEAQNALSRAARSDDPKVHILSRLALVDQGTAMGTMTSEEAVDELESLRFAWRGDEIEFDITERLGDTYWEINRYHDAITNWRRAVNNFPDHAPATALGEAIPGRLADLIIDDSADGRLNPLRASALYSEFKDMLPAGERGIEVALSVVDKLVSIDLLGQASLMLEELSREKLEGERAVRTALRQAGLRLLQNQPEAAMETLEWTDQILAATGAPNDLEAERRLLRADTLARLEQPEEALEVLTDQESRLAAAARVNIAWKAGLWREASEALADLVGVPPIGEDETMPPAQADTVINYGIALALADDADGLTDLAETFGSAIEKTDRAAVFRILTRGEAPLQPIRDLAAVRRQTSEIELFRDFLDSYRESAKTVAATES